MNNKSSDNVGAFFSAYIWLKHDADNKDFLRRMNIPEKRHVYVSRYTSTVIILLNENELERIKKDDDFLDWSYYTFDEPKKNDVILEQIGADKLNGSNSPLFNDGMGYSGNGIKVGVISAENLIFDAAAKSLEGIEITVLPSILPPKVDRHPTVVLSEIAGREIESDGVKLYGVTRRANLYFASTKTTKNVYEAIEKMLALGVKIINYSAGNNKGGYSDFDRQIDNLISSGDFLFVSAVGNIRQATSPGRAKNGISVGNLVTKSYPNSPISPPWNVWCKSEDDCSGFSNEGAHKPDLVAPGAWVGYVNAQGEIDFQNFGTSFACPWVSGAAAAVAEALDKEYSYLTLKAILLMSCDNQSVSENGNLQIFENIRLRSGYGLLDVKRAVEIAEDCEIYEKTISDAYTLMVDGMKNIMLTFEDNPNVTVTYDEEMFSLNGQNTLYIKKRSREEMLPLSIVGNAKFSLVTSI